MCNPAKAFEDVVKLVAGKDRQIKELEAENARLREALVEIAKGDGAFSRDPLEHAGNCIDNMKKIVEDAMGLDLGPEVNDETA